MHRVAVGLLIAVLASSCGGTPPPASGPASEPPTAGVEAEPPSVAPAGESEGTPLTSEELEALTDADAHPVSAANAAEDQLVGLLANASGLTTALGADGEAALAELLSAERRAAATELERRGGIPDWTQLEPGSTGAASPGGVVLAAARVPAPRDRPAADAADPYASFLTVVLADMVLRFDPGTQQEDTKGRVYDEVSITTTTSTLGYMLEIDEVASFDLERCPDRNGYSTGWIDLYLSVKGTSSSGETYGAIGELHVTVRATANDHADLVEIFGSIDGDLGAGGEEGQASRYSANKLWTSTPVSGGTRNRSSARRSGSYSGPAGFHLVLFSFANILASEHADAAEAYWSGGSCVSLGIDPPNPTIEGSKRTTEVTVSAESVRDEIDAKGKLTVTPSRGTFSPTRGETPLKIQVTVPQSASSANAKLEFRSVRGVGKRDLAVNAKAPLAWHVTLLQEGKGLIPQVGDASAHVDVEFTLRASKDLSELFSPDPDGSHELIPLTLEEATLEWYAEGSFRGADKTFRGSTSRIVDLDYSDPFWAINLPPKGRFVAGEGMVDPLERKLYVFLVAVGEVWGGGTYNLPPDTNCQVDRYTGTNQVFLVFDFDEQYRVAVGGCESTYRFESSSGGITAPWSTTWMITPIRSR